MPTHIRVADWERAQHYKHRNPPWIKLHNEILDSYEVAALPDASKWHLIGIYLLASRCNNYIPDDPAWIGQRIGARSPVDLDALIKTGKIQRMEDEPEEGVVPLRSAR